MAYSLTDTLDTRLTLCQSNISRHRCFNWLFIPGGPGIDSGYFDKLISELTLPGNVWRIDFPQNGSNFSGEEHDAEFDFDTWKTAFLHTVKSLTNVILVGHSFGAMFPLVCPEIEHDIEGFIVLNSAPSLWQTAAVQKAAERHLPSFSKALEAFEHNKTPETFKNAFNACMPYYFSEQSIDNGRQYIIDYPFNYHAAAWWLHNVNQTNYTAKWIPTCPMLIIGGSDDCCTPMAIYNTDERFKRDNIKMVEIQSAGHFPWVEQPLQVKNLFDEYIKTIEGN